MWAIRKTIKIPGLLFCIYLILNGIERFLIEKIRVNTEYNILGGITQAEIISACLVFIGIISSMYLLRDSKKI
jgi:prolipoprotein diacylglyceryltransferase